MKKVFSAWLYILVINCGVLSTCFSQQTWKPVYDTTYGWNTFIDNGAVRTLRTNSFYNRLFIGGEFDSLRRVPFNDWLNLGSWSPSWTTPHLVSNGTSLSPAFLDCEPYYGQPFQQNPSVWTIPEPVNDSASFLWEACAGRFTGMNCTLFPAEYGAQNIGFWRGDPDNSTYANNQSFSGMDTVFSMELILDKVNLTCNPDMRMYVAARCVFCDGTVNTDSTRYIAYYDRCPFGYNFMQGGTNGPVYAIEVLDTLNVYAGGRFDSAGVIGASNVAKWNGLTWDSLGLGVNGTVKVVLWDNNKLYVGGAFTSAGGNSASNIAVWDGVQWSTLGNGINGPVYSLTIQNGSLYAGGAFSAAGSVSANNIAKWDGSQWSDVSGGRNDEVYALAVYNNELYAGGNFTGGSTDTARYLARFGPLPNGMNEFLAGKPKSTIFPNPSTGAFSIEADEKIRTISVHTLQGEMILQKDVSQRRTEIDISNQPEGLYLIQVITKDWVEVHKIILH